MLPAVPRCRTFRRRLFAAALDALLVLPLHALDGLLWRGPADPRLLAAWVVVYSAAFPVYRIACHARGGRTLGKRLAGVRVLDLSGAKLGPMQALVRESPVLAYVALELTRMLPLAMRGWNPYDPDVPGPSGAIFRAGSAVWLLAVLASTVLSPRRRALHDFLARSVVVRTRKAPDE
jgi:uncharacterized RDD family membrane protein YckC